MSGSLRAFVRRRRTGLLIAGAILLLALDALRMVALPARHQNNLMNGFETLVAVLVAAACVGAASRSRRPTRGLWTLATAYFSLLALADLHDLLVGLTPAETSTVQVVLETLGWGTYLPLALLVFFPFSQEDRSPWSPISILDFAQVTLVLAVAFFHFIYLPRALEDRTWQAFDIPDLIRNVLIASGLLTRAVIDPSPKARRFYRWIGGMFTTMTFFIWVFRGGWTPIAIVGRPACLLAFGILATRWQEPAAALEPARRATLPGWLLGTLPLAGPLVVIALALDTPPPWDRWMPALIVTSLVVFVSRAALAEHDRRAHEEALRASEGRLRAFVDNAPYGITRLSENGDRLLAANPALVKMLGYTSAEEIASRPLSKALFESTEERDRFFSELPAHGRFSDREVQWQQRDGRAVTLRLSGRLADDGTEGGVVEAIVEDVTERRRIEAELRQAQKMEAVGQLAGGVAHEFNNLLGVIIGYGDLLLEEAKELPSFRQPLDEIRRAADHAASLTRRLLAFSHQEISQRQVEDLNEIVRDSRRLLGRVVGEQIELTTTTAPGELGVLVDRNQIEQVVINLALNARDAMPAGGRLTLETSLVEGGEGPESGPAGDPDRRWALLTVSDSGVGIAKEIRDRIFDPFFTTKPRGEGTGLGLSTVYGIVRESGGRVEVASEPGAGTTFRVYLPRVEIPGERRRRVPGREVRRGSETILLVEDGAPLRRLLCRLLESAGYTVLEAADGEEALRLVRERPSAVDLLLTDIVMPGLGGTDLAEAVRELRPRIPVLFISGYAEPEAWDRSRLGSGVDFLPKPFSREELSSQVRTLLDGEGYPPGRSSTSR